MIKSLTPKQYAVLQALYQRQHNAKPTDIGLDNGQRYKNAAAWACPALKALVKKRYAIRNGASSRSIWYEITEAGEHLSTGVNNAA